MEELSGIEGMYVFAVLCLVSMVIWYVRRQHSAYEGVLSEKQVNQLGDF